MREANERTTSWIMGYYKVSILGLVSIEEACLGIANFQSSKSTLSSHCFADPSDSRARGVREAKGSS